MAHCAPALLPAPAASQHDSPEPVLCGVTSPGGPARHFRVQCLDDANGLWHLYRSVKTRSEAERLAQQLRQAGRRVRVISYSRCAAAP